MITTFKFTRAGLAAIPMIGAGIGIIINTSPFLELLVNRYIVIMRKNQILNNNKKNIVSLEPGLIINLFNSSQLLQTIQILFLPNFIVVAVNTTVVGVANGPTQNIPSGPGGDFFIKTKKYAPFAVASFFISWAKKAEPRFFETVLARYPDGILVYSYMQMDEYKNALGKIFALIDLTHTVFHVAYQNILYNTRHFGCIFSLYLDHVYMRHHLLLVELCDPTGTSLAYFPYAANKAYFLNLINHLVREYPVKPVGGEIVRGPNIFGLYWYWEGIIQYFDKPRWVEFRLVDGITLGREYWGGIGLKYFVLLNWLGGACFGSLVCCEKSFYFKYSVLGGILRAVTFPLRAVLKYGLKKIKRIKKTIIKSPTKPRLKNFLTGVDKGIYEIHNDPITLNIRRFLLILKPLVWAIRDLLLCGFISLLITIDIWAIFRFVLYPATLFSEQEDPIFKTLAFFIPAGILVWEAANKLFYIRNKKRFIEIKNEITQIKKSREEIQFSPETLALLKALELTQKNKKTPFTAMLPLIIFIPLPYPIEKFLADLLLQFYLTDLWKRLIKEIVFVDRYIFAREYFSAWYFGFLITILSFIIWAVANDARSYRNQLRALEIELLEVRLLYRPQYKPPVQ